MSWFDDFFNWLKSLFPEQQKEEGSEPNIEAKESKMPSNEVDYIINDPKTKGLIERIPLPNKPDGMTFAVKNFKGGGYPLNSKEGRAANVWVTMANTIKMAQKYSPTPFKKWAAVSALAVFPEAGRDLNAYYDRRALKFFYAYIREMKKTLYTAESADIVAHELGHAILDAHRRDLWSMQALEVWAFHEAYADVNAILSILQHDVIIERMAENNRIGRPNIVSRLAEEMGDAIYLLTKGEDGRKPGALRDAINNFKYTQPERLPKDGPDDKLLGECHSFGRLFLGAWYEIFVKAYVQEKKKQSAVDALKTARDVMGRYITQAMIDAPATPRFYDAVARNMLAIDKKSNDGLYQAIMTDVFKKRRILLPTVKMLALPKRLLKTQKGDEITEHDKGYTLTRRKVELLKLSDELGLSALAVKNPLFNVEIEVPMDTYLEFDENKQLVDVISTNRQEAIESARACLVHLHETNQVSDDEHTMFEIKDGKLIRSHIE